MCLLLCLQYEPELFPGLIYRMLVPKVVLLIFVSGKVVLTGKPLACFCYLSICGLNLYMVLSAAFCFVSGCYAFPGYCC